MDDGLPTTIAQIMVMSKIQEEEEEEEEEEEDEAFEGNQDSDIGSSESIISASDVEIVPEPFNEAKKGPGRPKAWHKQGKPFVIKVIISSPKLKFCDFDAHNAMKERRKWSGLRLVLMLIWRILVKMFSRQSS
jgi:hypothetical protein